MKNLLLLCCLICTANAFAQTGLITIQRGAEALFFSDINAVQSAMQDGDKIIFQGGTFSGGLILNHEVEVYGTGHVPNSELPYRTQIGGLTIQVSNCTIEGIRINAPIYLDNTLTTEISNFTIVNCRFQALIRTTICQNIFTPNLINSTITNCLIDGGGPGCSSSWGIKMTLNNCLISNCQVYGRCYLNGSNYGFINCHYYFTPGLGNGTDYGSFFNGYISNSIFAYTPDNGNSSTFERNLFFGGEPSSTSNMNIENLLSVPSSSVFVGGTAYSPFAYTFDYHLQPSCPGVNYGTDGTDVGIYGGYYPWKDSTLPIVPVITNAVVPYQTETNGALPVQITVEAQQE